MNKNNGFTLIEILIALTFMSILMITLFKTMGSIQAAAKKVSLARELQKQIYFTYHHCANLFKNASMVTVSNRMNSGPLFKGDKESIAFISKAPVIFAFQTPHSIHLRFNDDALEYAEALFTESRRDSDGDDFSDEDYAILIQGITDHKLSYSVWDDSRKEFVWKTELDSFNGDPLPAYISMKFTCQGKEYDFLFKGFIHDKIM